nr:IS1634 family transposase [Rehaibacterium terrae]
MLRVSCSAMFIRASRSGKHTYLRLIEAYRDADGRTRHRQIAQLGRADQLSKEQVDALCASLRRLTGFQTPPLGTPEFEAAREVGGPWVLTELCRSLGLEDALRRALRSSRRQFDAEALVRLMVFNRICDPDSKLGVLRWLDGVVMPGLDLSGVHHQQLLRALDALDDAREALRRGMARVLKPLLDTEVSVVFYDLTTVRIHGEATVEDDVRRFGHPKETGGIARQFVLGLIQSADGLPLDFEVFEGDIGEVSTLLPMVQRVLSQYPIQRIVLVADRGLLSLDDVAELEALALPEGRRLDYVLAVPARRYAEMPDLVRGLRFRDGVAEGVFQGRRLVVAHDPERAKVQTAKRRARIEALEAFGDALAKKLDAQDEGEAGSGRRASDRGAFSRFMRRVLDEKLTAFVQADLHAERFCYSRNDAALADAEILDGKLVLLTSLDAKDLPAAEAITRYKSLADIERGFRVLKSDIEIAPVYHRLPERIRAHSQVCFLALLLHRVMRMRLKAGGAGLSVERAFEKLRHVQLHKARIGEASVSGLTKMDATQRALFDQLKVPQPREAGL